MVPRARRGAHRALTAPGRARRPLPTGWVSVRPAAGLSAPRERPAARPRPSTGRAPARVVLRLLTPRPGSVVTAPNHPHPPRRLHAVDDRRPSGDAHPPPGPASPVAHLTHLDRPDPAGPAPFLDEEGERGAPTQAGLPPVPALAQPRADRLTPDEADPEAGPVRTLRLTPAALIGLRPTHWLWADRIPHGRWFSARGGRGSASPCSAPGSQPKSPWAPCPASTTAPPGRCSTPPPVDRHRW